MLDKIINELITGRIDGDRITLSRGLHLHYRRPDGSSDDYRLLCHREGVEPSTKEMIIVRQALERAGVANITLEKPFKHGRFICRVFRWHPLPKQARLLAAPEPQHYDRRS